MFGNNETSGNYFDVLRIQPYLGRFFHASVGSHSYPDYLDLRRRNRSFDDKEGLHNCPSTTDGINCCQQATHHLAIRVDQCPRRVAEMSTPAEISA
jgi:hypothetical protein